MTTNRLASAHALHLSRHRTNSTTVDPSRLAPEDAYFVHSPPRDRTHSPLGIGPNGVASSRSDPRRSRTRDGRRGGNRRTRAWAKLLWVKQSYPDNFTDEYTFLDHLQRNPRLQPYEFWELFADSSVVVQQVCSVGIFLCCFTGIYQERISPASVVTYSSIATIIGWVLWDFWAGRNERDAREQRDAEHRDREERAEEDSPTAVKNHGSSAVSTATTPAVSRPPSPYGGSAPPTPTGHPAGEAPFAAYANVPLYRDRSPHFSTRTQVRLSTIKSAIVIYFCLLGLSPILKSLTKSTSSDSIWAMSAVLMIINIFFFDYGGGPGAIFPAAISTNAGIMASTVLASRLSSTSHVFSLSLFSIEVFGLFPIFRRHLKHVSRKGDVAITYLLVVIGSASVGVIISGGGWLAAVLGCVLGSIIVVLAMGICSWWLIGLQKYKNEIHGPWDPARPIVRQQWG